MNPTEKAKIRTILTWVQIAILGFILGTIIGQLTY